MKKKIGSYAAVCMLLFVSLSSFSQAGKDDTPSWVSDKGYWVVESNLHQPREHSIRFYNNENILIGTQHITGTKLNPKKRKVKMQLKSMLESSLLVWNKQHETGDTTPLVKHP